MAAYPGLLIICCPATGVVSRPLPSNGSVRYNIMAPEPISTAYFINTSHLSVSACVSPRIIARQRLGKHVPVATDTRNNWIGGSVIVRVVSKGSGRLVIPRTCFTCNLLHQRCKADVLSWVSNVSYWSVWWEAPNHGLNWCPISRVNWSNLVSFLGIKLVLFGAKLPHSLGPSGHLASLQCRRRSRHNRRPSTCSPGHRLLVLLRIIAVWLIHRNRSPSEGHRSNAMPLPPLPCTVAPWSSQTVTTHIWRRCVYIRDAAHVLVR
jgi:hypothetical protein